MIGFVGLSHLGLNYSLATAARGFDVLAYDPDRALVERLGSGDVPIEEPGFMELLKAQRRRLRYSADAGDLQGCDLVFFSLDVATNDRNESDLGPLTQLIEGTAPALAPGATVVVLSQVRPGYTRALTRRLGLSAGSCFYQVETLIFGAAVRRATEPERFIVGAENPASPLPARYRTWLDAFACPVLVMRLESAELAKVAINLFLVSSVSTTNTLAELCESIGADWSEIAPALKLDRRIGPHAYLKPGLGIAGGNLERDLVTVRALAAERGTEAGVVDAWLRTSEHAKGWALRTLERELLSAKPGACLAVWGLTYKEDTHSFRNSASLALVQALPGCAVHAFDPAARVPEPGYPNLTVHDDMLGTLAEADALAIMTPWGDFQSVSAKEIRSRMRGDLVVDPYAMLDRAGAAREGLRHFVRGAGSSPL
jgi:UDPglucose 6-dehydrogenase